MNTLIRRLVVAAAILTATIGLAGPASAAWILGGGASNIGGDLMCGTRVVSETMPIVSGATPGQTVVEISLVVRYDYSTRRWVTETWGIRQAVVGASGSSGTVWVDFHTGQNVRSQSYSVRSGTYAIAQYAAVDGVWHARWSVGISGNSFCYT